MGKKNMSQYRHSFSAFPASSALLYDSLIPIPNITCSEPVSHSEYSDCPPATRVDARAGALVSPLAPGFPSRSTCALGSPLKVGRIYIYIYMYEVRLLSCHVIHCTLMQRDATRCGTPVIYWIWGFENILGPRVHNLLVLLSSSLSK